MRMTDARPADRPLLGIANVVDTITRRRHEMDAPKVFQHAVLALVDRQMCARPQGQLALGCY
jgi:hypothetical protein